MMPRRPLRSVFLGNPRYLSAYKLGVGQAMGILGAWHRTVSLFDDPGSVVRQIAEMEPDVIWTHMALWPPAGALTPPQIAEILAPWRARGAAIYHHDGDPRTRPLPEVDMGSVFSVALVNRAVGVDTWPIPCVRWPYAAMVQRAIGEPRPAHACDLLFAGHLRADAIYGTRTALVQGLQAELGPRMRIVCPGGGDTNNRMLVADVAPSVGAVLGFARPEVPGWIDTRVFQYPGAGGVLIHDDAGEFLEPDVHYLRFDRTDAHASVLRCVARAKAEGPALRERAFRHVQRHHTWVQRVEVALAAFFGVGA
jgi:hypothetical protein